MRSLSLADALGVRRHGEERLAVLLEQVVEARRPPAQGLSTVLLELLCRASFGLCLGFV